jgi:DNA-nicking Smr family endonuclease
MKRPLRPDELALWGLVTATVRPAHGRAVPPSSPAAATDQPRVEPIAALIPPDTSRRVHTLRQPPAPEAIEPGRRRRIVREREDIAARLDLHGYDQDRARQALHAFIQRAHAAGARAVLVVTGKGRLGDGVIRRRAPEWLAEPPSRALVAGLSPADRRHGGDGALYIALKRRG